MELTFKQAKEFFFDRMKVIEAVEKGRADALSKLGGFVRTSARRSMRKARRMRESELSETQLALFKAAGGKRENLPLKSSEPGQPPRVRKGSLKNGILFAYDPKTKSVVAGPVKFNISGDAAANLEYGGMTEITVVELDKSLRKGRRATGRQLEAFLRKRSAGTLPDRRASLKRRVKTKVAKRPYMSPALEKARPIIATKFQDLIKS
jgi:hypothetical protein